MVETVNLSELVIPGTSVRARGSVPAGSNGISTGNIGIVGTAADGLGDITHVLLSYGQALDVFGDYDAYDGGDGDLNLTRSIELLYLNGAHVVYARALDPSSAQRDDYIAAFNELAKDDVNILVAPELSTTEALEVFGSVLESAESNGRDVIAIVGSDEITVSNIVEQTPENDRIVMTTPGIRAFDATAGADVVLSGTYGAAAVAGLVGSLSPHTTLTGKALAGVAQLTRRFSRGEIGQLIENRVAVLEQRQGVRVARGLTTGEGTFAQITTRRTIDYAKAGIRRVGEPFIGKLSSNKVRAALRGAIDSFLTTMVRNEALVGYSLEVTASHEDEISGRAMVNVIAQPAFGSDFIAVTLVLE